MESDSRVLGISRMDTGHVRSFLKEVEGKRKQKRLLLPAQGVCSELDRAQPHASGIERPHWGTGGGGGVQSKARRDSVVLGWRGFGARSLVLRP